MNIAGEHSEEMLQILGLKRTPGRIALLKVLTAEKKPVTVEHLQKKLRKDLDPVSLYRALEAFEEKKLVVHFDFGHGHAHYELTHEGRHHHHAICENCGKIEDIPAHDSPHFTSSALKASSGFSRFTRHSLEFYGICTSCTRQT